MRIKGLSRITLNFHKIEEMGREGAALESPFAIIKLV
jgi:hypothetical protein